MIFWYQRLYIYRCSTRVRSINGDLKKYIRKNVEMTTAEANAKVIADMDEAQASFMTARAEKKKAEEMKVAGRRK